MEPHGAGTTLSPTRSSSMQLISCIRLPVTITLFRHLPPVDDIAVVRSTLPVLPVANWVRPTSHDGQSPAAPAKHRQVIAANTRSVLIISDTRAPTSITPQTPLRLCTKPTICHEPEGGWQGRRQGQKGRQSGQRLRTPLQQVLANDIWPTA